MTREFELQGITFHVNRTGCEGPISAATGRALGGMMLRAYEALAAELRQERVQSLAAMMAAHDRREWWIDMEGK